MKGRLKIQDTADVYMKFADNTVRYFGCMNTTSIEKTVDTEDIRCGIGAGLASILYSNVDITMTLTPAFFNEWLIEYQSGGTAVTGNRNVWVTEADLVGTTATADATCVLVGTPVGGIVKAQDKSGKIYPATFLTGTVTVTGGANKGPFDISYQKAVATAETIDIRTDTFPAVVGIILHTIGYDVTTNVISTDVYFEFDRVIGDGGMNLSLALQTNSVNEVTARALPVAGVLGRYISAPRA